MKDPREDKKESDVAGKPGDVSVSEDPTQRYQLMKTLLDTLPDLICLKDPKGRYILNNRAHLRSLGVEDQAKVSGKTTFDFNPPELAKQYFDDEMQIVRTGIALLDQVELAVHRDTGEKRWHLTSKIPLKNPDGKVAAIVCFSHDITVRKHLEEQRDHYIAQLHEALDSVRTLSGLLPICASCKKIRDDRGYWQQVEGYIADHSEVRFTHSVCPDCLNRICPDSETGNVDCRD